MSRESESYRPELQEILEYFSGKRVLTTADVMSYTGRSRDWVRSHEMTGEITAVQLALKLTKLGKDTK